MNLFSSKESKKKAIIAALLILFVALIFVFFVLPMVKYLINPSKFKIFLNQFGVWAPIAFILIQTLQMAFLIIPGAAVLVAGGYVFGRISIIYSIIGIMIGSVVVFEISKLFGKPFIESIMNKKIIGKLNEQSENVGKTLFILFLIPPLPHDLFSFAAGISNLKLKDFLLISFIGRLPLIVFYTLVGYQLTKLNLFYSLLLLSIILLGSYLIFRNKDKLEENLKKYIK